METSQKFSVDVVIEGRVRWGGSVEMTRAEYDEWCERIDSARGFHAEEVASDVMDAAAIDFRDLDVVDMRVEDFVSSAIEDAKAASESEDA